MSSRARAFADALSECGFRGRVRVERRRRAIDEEPYVEWDYVVLASIVAHPATRRMLVDAARSVRWELSR